MVPPPGLEPGSADYLSLRDISPLLYQLSYGGYVGAPGGIRTPDRRFRRPMLFSTELPGHVARGLGIEPSSPALQAGAELPN